MQDINDVVNEVKALQGATAGLLRDTLGDYKKIGFRKDLIILFLVAAMVSLFVFTQWSHNVAQDRHTAAILQLASEHEQAMSVLSEAHERAWTEFWGQYDFAEYSIEQSYDTHDNGGDISNSGNNQFGN